MVNTENLDCSTEISVLHLSGTDPHNRCCISMPANQTLSIWPAFLYCLSVSSSMIKCTNLWSEKRDPLIPIFNTNLVFGVLQSAQLVSLNERQIFIWMGEFKIFIIFCSNMNSTKNWKYKLDDMIWENNIINDITFLCVEIL